MHLMNNETDTNFPISKTQHRILNLLEIFVLIAVPATLGICAYYQMDQSAFFSITICILAIAIFFIDFEIHSKSLKSFTPTVVLAALASAGRILFAAIPNVKPVSALCIISGAIFGKHCGFMVGALTALVSNCFFGQGPWTAWQMYSWGLMGYMSGVFFYNSNNSDADSTIKTSLSDTNSNLAHNTNTADEVASNSIWKKLIHQLPIYIFGFIAPLVYGFISNCFYIVGYIHPITLPAAISSLIISLPTDCIHAISTVVFLAVLYTPLRTKLIRIRKLL